MDCDLLRAGCVSPQAHSAAAFAWAEKPPVQTAMSLPFRSNLVRAALYLKLIVAIALSASVAPSRADTTFVPAGGTWRYLDNGSNQGTAWRATSFVDTSWKSGTAELGYGDGDEATVISFGPNSSAKYITTYFRHTFSVTDPAAYQSLRLRLLRDDGAVVYLNGVEILRSNMPGGTVSYTTVASTAIGGADEVTFFQSSLSPSNLLAGTNVLAVEVHQANATSSDVSFDLELVGLTSAPSVAVTRGPYLQKSMPTAVTVRWRTDAATNSTVRYGLTAANLDQQVSDSVSTTEHEVTITGLAPHTQYFYSIGTSAVTLASGPDFSFFTPPPVGTAQPTRVWVLGDSGTADARAAAVRNGYTNFAAARYTDVWLMLGDNAYNSGTDTEFQAAVFNMYPSYLRQSALWSAVGNHDTASSTNPPLTIPYFQIHNFPTAGEAGGIASGTEKYYSFDYGRIHFIAIDSMTSSRAPGSPMLTWLQNDLASTTQDWIIAFCHHPPYSKGSHNSDVDIESIEIRQNILPILEAGGVDLMLTGHSHNYERSYFINGHYGSSSTFNSTMKLNGGSGREDGTGSYTKPGNLAANQGAVYVVAGNGGHVTNWTGGSTAEFNPTPHPAMFYSALHLGSLVLDINGNRLDAKMIRETGAIDDYFTIVKSVPNALPTVQITSPAEGASFTAPATIAVTANASDTDGTVTQVDFYANNTLIGTVTTPPFQVTWENVGRGSYALTAAATDNLGATTTSAAVNITVNDPPPTEPPAAPVGLTATAGNGQVALTWSGSSGATGYSVKRAEVSGGPYVALVSGITATNYTDTSVNNGTTYYYVVTASNSVGESGNSNEVSALPTAPITIPSAPTGLSATAFSRSRVDLRWTDTATNESGYRVERSTNGSTFTQIATPGADTVSYSDATVLANKQYYYRVRAYNSAGASAYSNTAKVKTPR